MKIGVFEPKEYQDLPFSFKIYLKNIIRELTKEKVEFYFLKDDSNYLSQNIDIFWDPFSGISFDSWQKLIKKVHLVITFLGDFGLDISLKDFYGNSSFNSLLKRLKTKLWLRLKYRKNIRDSLAGIITVSEYSKRVLTKYLKFKEKKVEVIHHGVDLKVFNPQGISFFSEKPYFLHISQYVPGFHYQKNIKRILRAYFSLSDTQKFKLILVIPNYPERIEHKGVKLIRKEKPQEELAKLYRGAVAFVFPSLHESFGMPILEAMACGCPVITSNSTACREVAGKAALLVNPHSQKEISKAMERLIKEETLRRELQIKGLQRVKKFSWRKSAKKHLEIFNKILS